MKIPALIMAGGKGQRMGALPVEKPLLPFLGKPLVDWVAEAVASAKNVSEFYVVSSPNTQETEKHCRQKGWKVLRTDAKGYHNDLKQATREANLMGPVLTIPADSPALTGKFLDKVVTFLRHAAWISMQFSCPSKPAKSLGFPLTLPTNTEAYGTPSQESISSTE